MPSRETTRFAPSPTGALHLGHAYAALLAHGAARENDGRFLVRMEDLDQGRCTAGFATGILEDLAWLGLNWDGPVRRQSERSADYRVALEVLIAQDLVYPCFCTRGAIAREIETIAAAPQGPDGPLYPGTCRHLTADERHVRVLAGQTYAVRLDINRAVDRLHGTELCFEETGQGPAGESGRIVAQPGVLGDVVLGRKDSGVSYHLAVVVDDADQGVSLVTRGDDLYSSAHVQRLLQALLDVPSPRYRHHPLIRDDAGRRLAKRDSARTLAALRATGVTPKEIRRQLGLG